MPWTVRYAMGALCSFRTRASPEVFAAQEYSTTAKVLLVLVALVPLGIGIVCFTAASKHPEGGSTARVRSALWVVFAIAQAGVVLGVAGARYVMIIAFLLLFVTTAVFRRRQKPHLP